MTARFSKVLVTGGAGFIGSHTVDALLQRGVEVGVLDNFFTGERRNLASHLTRVKLHEGDIRDVPFVRDAVKNYEAIIHQAALVSVKRSVEDPLRSNAVNVEGTVNLLTAAKDSGVKRFVYASSSSVYGESETLPKIESMNTVPISPYAVSKLAAELYCRVFARVYGLSTVSLRYFNVYGPRQKYGPYSGVVPIFIQSILKGQAPTVYGDGLQTRDFTFVKDVVQANLLSLERDVAPGSFFNIAGGNQTSVNELAESLARKMGMPDMRPRYADPRPGDVKRSYADISKAASELGYRPAYSLDSGLKEVVEWFEKANPFGKGKD